MPFTDDKKFYYLEVPGGMSIDCAARGARELSEQWGRRTSFLFNGIVIEADAKVDTVYDICRRYNSAMEKLREESKANKLMREQKALAEILDRWAMADYPSTSAKNLLEFFTDRGWTPPSV